MDAIRLRNARERLFGEYEQLVRLLKRSKLASEEITVENTEDEGDLASKSHDKEVLYNLHEGNFARLQLIQTAIEAIDGGQYGLCVRCEGDIAEKRLEAVPWAAMCFRCQEEAEGEQTSSRMAFAGFEDEDEQ
jgi:DnaK suppressor protein